MDTMAISAAAASLSTVLGSLLALLFGNVSHRGRDMLLAYTAGIMVAASTYSLIPSALKLSNLGVLTIGILLGTVMLTLMERFIPHTDHRHDVRAVELPSRSMLFITAMALHNLPEGLSVGISFASEHQDLGALVSFAIGLQNAPEGFLVVLFLLSQRISAGKAVLYAAFTAGAELAACFVGFHFAGLMSGLVPYGLAFAAGAMLYVVYKELIPESHGDGHETSATFAFIGGLLTMIALTHWLH